MQNPSDKDFIHLATKIAEFSTCVKKKVGAVIVKDKKIISTGYNNPPRYECSKIWPKTGCPRTNKNGCLYSIHAEHNAIINALKKNTNLNSSEIFITLSPCLSCAKLIYSVGITKVIYDKYYSEYKNVGKGEEEGINFLHTFKIQIYKFEDYIQKNIYI